MAIPPVTSASVLPDRHPRHTKAEEHEARRLGNGGRGGFVTSFDKANVDSLVVKGKVMPWSIG